METTYINQISGDFIQHYLYQDWTEERWDREIARLKALGVEYIIVDTIGRARMKDGDEYGIEATDVFGNKTDFAYVKIK